MYFVLLTAAYCVLYLGLVYLFPFFFGAPRPTLAPRILRPLWPLIGACIVIFTITHLIEAPVLANRFQHAFGGGFLAFLTCFLAARASGLAISRFQFWFFSLLIVTALGVVNEMLEFTLQNYFNFFFTANLNDTWLDLISNTVGILVASFLLLPFVRYTGE